MLSCNTARFSVKANLILSEYNKLNGKKLKFSSYRHTHEFFYNNDGTELPSSKPAVNSYALTLFRFELPAAVKLSRALTRRAVLATLTL
jgi:hypothetical protein